MRSRASYGETLNEAGEALAQRQFRSCIVGLALMATLACTPAAWAQDMAAQVKQRGCSACHDATQARVGPSFKTMAERYRADPEKARSRFTNVLVKGAGHPKGGFTDEELKQLIDWIAQH